MHRALLVAATIGLVGCAPPDPAQSIEILFPTHDTDRIEVSADGVVESLVVVDIDGFIVMPEGEADPQSDIEGHWHIYVNNNYRGAIGDGFTTTIRETGVAPDQPFSITVSLARDNHDEIEDDLGRIDDTVELVTEASGEASAR